MMNKIHEHLSATKSPVQLVKHFDEVIDKHKIYPMIVQLKHDGVYALQVVQGGQSAVYSRTGNLLFSDAVACVIGDWTKLPDGVYIGELICPVMSLEELSGIVSPNRKKALNAEEISNLMCYGCIRYHDYLTFDELLAGSSDKSYKHRYRQLYAHLASANLNELIVESSTVNSYEEIEQIAERYIAAGLEGVVVKQPDASWLAGHKGYRAMKIVRGVSLDLRCVGVLYGKGKRADQIAALEFEYKGNKFKADLGKGWTDERRAELTKNYELTFDPHKVHEAEFNPIGKIWEVKALDISSTGKALRLPKVVRVRWDKDEPDA
ncbi:ATP-dependent DNA ligase [Acinetobacter phage Petty]|uniref:DNA ligase n=1 Tax=Acinetobacter phage Petty TaxID=1406779 RepID=U5PZL8_9CAUD|nr:ATP-dependent DNA ligase [Acinetobacter phage Petty]AGY47988.1 DNA ligase [Acinetobacter phage Petty]